GLREIQQPGTPRRKRPGAELDLVPFAELVALKDERHETAVPTPQVCRLELHRLDRAGADFLVYGVNDWQAGPGNPVARQSDQEHTGRLQFHDEIGGGS